LELRRHCAESAGINAPALPPAELDIIRAVFARHPEITQVKVFGSRAKGTQRPESDVDLALAAIKLQSLRDHIERVGITIFPVTGA
jgi:predicted nucleotidyltransferase